LQKKDSGKAEALHRFNFGMYFFLERQHVSKEQEE